MAMLAACAGSKPALVRKCVAEVADVVVGPIITQASVSEVMYSASEVSRLVSIRSRAYMEE